MSPWPRGYPQSGILIQKQVDQKEVFTIESDFIMTEGRGKKENKNERRLLSQKACRWWRSICFTQLPTYSWIFVSQMIHSTPLVRWHSFCQAHTLDSPTLLHESSPKSIMTWGPCCPLIGQFHEEFNALNHWSFLFFLLRIFQINSSHSCFSGTVVFKFLPACCIRQNMFE